MSDPYTTRNQARGLEQTRVIERSPLYPPWSQRVLNPFPLASSGGIWGDMPQPWGASLLAWTVTVTVITTNNATNFWTVALLDAAGATLASFTTAAITVNVSTRVSVTTITQPSAANPFVEIKLTATLNPGAIYVFPALAVLRTGN